MNLIRWSKKQIQLVENFLWRIAQSLEKEYSLSTSSSLTLSKILSEKREREKKNRTFVLFKYYEKELENEILFGAENFKKDR